MRTRIRCHVIETPVERDVRGRGGRGYRELLPWADPYIAGLMRRLEGGSSESNDDLSNPFAQTSESGENNGMDDDWQDDDWQVDAFIPLPLEEPRFHCHPPVIGGFPLLDDE